MAFEVLKSEIGFLLGKLTDQSEDRQELEFQLREKLNEMKALGMPLPDDLLRLEAMLDEQLSEDVEKRKTHQSKVER
ncbi:MAG: hypothetical protein ACK5JT_22285 [Hyphomicrobiaceae bacterium]